MAVIAKITNPETTTAMIEGENMEEVEKPLAAEASEENEVCEAQESDSLLVDEEEDE